MTSQPIQPHGSIGPYQIVRPLGAGGMGEVFLAHHTVLKRDVVVKRILPGLAANPAIVQRFLIEAQAAAKLEHRNVVRINEATSDAHGVPYLVLEYLRGQALGDFLATWRSAGQPVARAGQPVLPPPPRPVPPTRAFIFTVQAGAGLDHAHQHKIIHRDIKPDNLFRTTAPQDQHAHLAAAGLPTDDHIKVLDFGIAKLIEGERATQTGSVIGTPSYMSPEQLRGHPLDIRSDVYALGCVHYELLTGGRLPWAGAGSMVEIAQRQDAEPPPDPRAYVPGLPAGIATVVRTAMARRPADRYATIGDFMRALAAETPAGDGLPDGRFILEKYAPELSGAAPATAPAVGHGASTDALPGPAVPTTLGSSVHTRGLAPGRRGLLIALGAIGAAAVAVTVAIVASSGGSAAPAAVEGPGAVAVPPVDAAVPDAAPLDAATVAPALDATPPPDAAPPPDARRRTHHAPASAAGSGSGSTRGIRDVLHPDG